MAVPPRSPPPCGEGTGVGLACIEDPTRRASRGDLPTKGRYGSEWHGFAPHPPRCGSLLSGIFCTRLSAGHEILLIAEGTMNRIVARLFAALTVLAVLVGAAVPVRAQDYPTRPVKIIIAFPVGGLLDVVSRIV